VTGVLDTSDWTVGDRQQAFTVLLPAVSGPVVVAVPPWLEAVLTARYPHVVPVRHAGGDLVLPDGTPCERGTAELVVVDPAVAPPELVRRVLVADGTLAVLGPRGDHRIHPDARHPEQVWRPGWPVPSDAGAVRWARRQVALRLPGRGATWLRTEGPARPLVDDVVADVGDALACELALVGIVTAGHTVLRLRSSRGDVGVRLSLTGGDTGARGSLDDVLRDVPGLAGLVPEELGRGVTHGHRWLAMRWIPGPGLVTTTRYWLQRPQRRAALAEALVERLAAAPTGATGPGWAERWCTPVDVLPPHAHEPLVRALAPLEDALPTGWCHGDLWSGNLLCDRHTAGVIDWDNAVRDAPLGIDRVLLCVLGPLATPAGYGQVVSARLLALAELDEGPGAPRGEIAGRRWGEWPVEVRRALALAAAVLHLRNRSMLDLGEQQRDREVEAILASPAVAGEPAAPAVEPDSAARTAPAEARRAARGAMWLATSSIVVKGSQTLVLLVLAALLAPTALGLLAIGALVANVSTILANLGTGHALVYWRGDVQRAARTAVTIALVSGGLITALLWAVAPFLASSLRAEDGAPVIRGLVSVVPLVAVAYVTGELLRRQLAFRRRVVPDIVGSIVGAAVAVVLAASGVGVMSLVVGQVVQGVLMLLLAWVVHPPVLPGWNPADARGLLSYGGPLSAAALLEMVQLNLDYIVVSRVLGPLALGLYSMAFRLAYLPHLMIAVVVTGAAFPYLCRRSAGELPVAAERVAVVTLTLVTPVCAGIVLLSDHLVLLGEEWVPAVPAVAWLGVYAWLLAIGQVAQVTLNASGRPSRSFALRLLQLVGLLVALPVAVSRGIVAVAVAQGVVAFVVAAVAFVVVSRTVTGLSARRLLRGLASPVVAAGVMAFVLLATRELWPGEPSVSGLAVLAALGLATYLATTGLLDRDTFRQARGLLRRTS
jgi:O-antigen/teichoic acid export membrane protein